MPETLNWIVNTCDADRRKIWLAGILTLEEAVAEYSVMQAAIDVYNERKAASQGD